MQSDIFWSLRQQINSVAPELDPPPMHWLESDAGISYCRKCAITARGKEFEFGPPIRNADYYRRTELEHAFFDGMRSYAHGCAGHSDITEACYHCGITLAYWLTDYGISSELDHWSKAEMTGDLSEIAYNIDRLFECSDEQWPEVEVLARRFLEYAETKK